MKKLLLVPAVLIFTASLFGQCETSEDARNTPSSCKRGENKIFMDISQDKAAAKEAEKWMTAIFTSVINEAINKTKGLRGTWSASINSVHTEKILPYNIKTHMLELGCTKEKKLYEKEESGLVLSLSFNSLNSIAAACSHQEYGDKNEEKEVTETVDGRQIYILHPRTESEKYGSFAWYINDGDARRIVVSKPGIPLFVPVSIKEILSIKKAYFTVMRDHENKIYNDILAQTFEQYLVQLEYAKLAAQYSKTEADEIKEKYKKSYIEGKENVKTAKEKNLIQKYIDNIDKYIRASSEAQLDKPFIGNMNIGYDPITNDMFKNPDDGGSPAVTLNPDYINSKLPISAPQFVTVEIRNQTSSATTLKAKKVFEDNFDFNKLQEMLVK